MLLILYSYVNISWFCLPFLYAADKHLDYTDIIQLFLMLLIICTFQIIAQFNTAVESQQYTYSDILHCLIVKAQRCYQQLMHCAIKAADKGFTETPADREVLNRLNTIINQLLLKAEETLNAEETEQLDVKK